ncbi:MAG: hypothetical protein KHX03_00615 [Clostridium sp.]|nr:hypothetical protein [Clostridium sp.]
MIKKFIGTFLLIVYFFTFTEGAGLCAIKKNKVFKGSIEKNVKQEIPAKKQFKMPEITDETAEELSAAIDKRTLKKHKYNETIISDEPVIISNENKKFKKPKYTGIVKTEYGTEVLLKPVYKVSTKNSQIKIPQGKKYDKYKVALPEIGERIPFKVVKDVKVNDKIVIRKDTIVYAKIGEVSPRAMGGAPAEMTIEQFEIKDENGNIKPLDGSISSSGYSLSFWIGLAELATTPFLFGLAVPLLRLLPGGQAVVSPRKKYMVYY